MKKAIEEASERRSTEVTTGFMRIMRVLLWRIERTWDFGMCEGMVTLVRVLWEVVRTVRVSWCADVGGRALTRHDDDFGGFVERQLELTR